MNITHHMSGLRRTDRIQSEICRIYHKQLEPQSLTNTCIPSEMTAEQLKREASYAERVKAHLKNRILDMHLSGSKGRKYGTTTKAKCDALPNTAALTNSMRHNMVVRKIQICIE